MTAEPRILIVRLSAIGDVVQGMPIACALRDHFPNSWIAWALHPHTEPLVKGHPAIDETIPVAKGWMKSPWGCMKVRRMLRSRRFDIAIDAQGLTKSALLAWFSGAPCRIGYGQCWGRELSRWFNNKTVDTSDCVHVVDRNLCLLKPLGIQNPVARFNMPIAADVQATSRRMLARLGLTVGGFAVVNVGAGWPSKLWPAERYAALAQRVQRAYGLPFLVIWAGDEEHRMAQKVVERSAGSARLAPPTNLVELAALSSDARLFVGSDTGPLHIAAAVGTPCVGLYGPWPAKRHGPYGRQHISIQKMFFEGTVRQRRHASPAYMEAIDVDSVFRGCGTILSRAGMKLA